jgi:hypothetical protein
MATTDYPHRTEDTLLSASDPFVEALDLSRRPVINGEMGGVYGWASNIFDYLNAQPHVSQQAYCIVMATPAMFSKLPGGDRLTAICKAWFENRSRSFEGLRDQTTHQFAVMEFTGHKFSIPTGATRELGAVTHVGYDVEGEIFTKMFKIWSEYGVMDPEILNAKLVLLDDPGDMLMDDVSVSVCYFEPTRNMRDVSHAAIMVASQPTNTVPIELKRNKAEENTLREISMEMTGLVEFDTLACKQIARTFLALMPLYNPAAVDAPSGFKDRSAAVVAASDTGTIETMTLNAATVISTTTLSTQAASALASVSNTVSGAVNSVASVSDVYLG